MFSGYDSMFSGYENIQQLFIQRYAPLLEGAFKTVGEYSVDLFTRYKMYMIVGSVTNIGLRILGLVVTGILFQRIRKKFKEAGGFFRDDAAPYGISGFFLIVMLLICFGNIIAEISLLPKKVIIPEVYIYQDLTHKY